MEKRTVSQVKLFRLTLNPVTEKFEVSRLAAVSTNYDALVKYYEGEVSERTYRGEDGCLRVFKKGSKLENYHLTASVELGHVDYCGHGVSEDWVNEDVLAKIEQDAKSGNLPYHYVECEDKADPEDESVVEADESDCDGQCEECTCEATEVVEDVNDSAE